MQQEDDLRGLAKVMEFMRAISIIFVVIHVYWYCYQAIVDLGIDIGIVDRILLNFQRTAGLFRNLLLTKMFALIFLALSCLGTKGVKNRKMTWEKIYAAYISGLVLFFMNWWMLDLPLPPMFNAGLYIVTLTAGYILLLMAGIWTSRMFRHDLMDDVFNTVNESFMQETRLMENEYSVNLPTRFVYQGREWDGWINVVNPFRASIVLGTPGSGKSYAVVNNYIRQQIAKGFAMYLYDYKFDDLSIIAYNELLKNLDKYKVKPEFDVINFEVKAAKSELPKNIWETVSAFSNTSGGWIILGVKQSGKTFEIQGVDNIEKLEQDFLGTLRSGKFNQTLFPHPKRYDIDGCRLLAFYIPEVDMKPLYFGNPTNTFLRMGSGDQRATEGEIRAMFRDQSFGKKTEETIPDSGIEMLNPESLHNYRFALGETSNLSDLRDADDADFCESVNITNNGLLTYAGLLMFGKSPYVLRYVPTFCVDYIEIPAPTIQQAEIRYTYRIPEQQNIWDAVQIILRRFRTLVDAPIHIKEDGFATTDESQYLVLREALANMLMHCDHFDSLRSCIRVYTDHIEFMNGGAFPLPVNEILGKVYSKLRNPTIAKLFRYVGIAENAGYGMKKLTSWETLTGARPTIESDRTVATVTFPLKSAIQRLNVSDVPVNVPVNVPVRLTDTQQKVLELIRTNPSITHLEMSQVLAVNEKTAKRATQALRELGFIKREGSDKTGQWVIFDK